MKVLLFHQKSHDRVDREPGAWMAWRTEEGGLNSFDVFGVVWCVGCTSSSIIDGDAVDVEHKAHSDG